MLLCLLVCKYKFVHVLFDSSALISRQFIVIFLLWTLQGKKLGSFKRSVTPLRLPGYYQGVHSCQIISLFQSTVPLVTPFVKHLRHENHEDHSRQITSSLILTVVHLAALFKTKTVRFGTIIFLYKVFSSSKNPQVIIRNGYPSGNEFNRLGERRTQGAPLLKTLKIHGQPGIPFGVTNWLLDIFCLYLRDSNHGDHPRQITSFIQSTAPLVALSSMKTVKTYRVT